MTTTASTRGTQGLDVTIRTTAPRLTPAPASRRFRDALAGGAQALLSGVEAAASLVPGGAAISAAIRGGRATPTGAEAPEGPGAGGEQGAMADMLQQSADQNMMYLRLQERMSAENRRYTALSNVMKARHDTAKASINNIR